ncbi:MAG: hypothetical protein F4213_08475 [Boseongicola sp. SB0677_bin_26]|nr:hypothetical protein [Boseongicola sp. SB0665_bin_10]MYG26046.1 hypothetical protein [Boseongicola sp. SB0677_bin_26]
MRTDIGIATLLMVLPSSLWAETWMLDRMLGGAEWSAEMSALEDGKETHSGVEISFPGFEVSFAFVESLPRRGGGVELEFRDLVVAGAVEDEAADIRLILPSGRMDADVGISQDSDGTWDPCDSGLVSISSDGAQATSGTGFEMAIETGPVTIILDGTQGCQVFAEAADLQFGAKGIPVAKAALALEMFQADEAGRMSSRMALNDVEILFLGTEAIYIESVGFDTSFDDGSNRWGEALDQVEETLGGEDVIGGLWNAALDDTSRMELHVKGASPVGGLLEALLGTSLVAEGRQADLVFQADQTAKDGSLGIGIVAPGLVRLAVDLGVHLDSVSADATVDELMENIPFRLSSVDVELHDQGVGAIWESETGADLAGTLAGLAAAVLPEGQALEVSRWLAASRKGTASFSARPAVPIGLDEIVMMAMTGDFVAFADRMGMEATLP